MNFILFDDQTWSELRPLTFTRPVAEMRIGILTIREKWERYLAETTSWLTQDYLSEKYPLVLKEENVLINGSVLPNQKLKKAILQLKVGEFLMKEEVLLATKLTAANIELAFSKNEANSIQFEYEIERVSKPYDIIQMNNSCLLDDFELLTKGRKSQEISNSVTTIGKENIFLEEGAKVEGATLNAQNGPVYIGKNAEIMEGSLVRGPLALCENSVLNLGTKIYGPTTLGPYCKCGGELNNVVLFGYSNKAHDGFLGHAVLGEWCNIGAGTSNSNLKNNYSEVKLWNYTTERFDKTGLQFCGTIIGDHSKFGINTMLNTGTVVGVSANVFGAGFPRNFIPSFSMGGNHGFKEYRLSATFEVAKLMMKRRGVEFNDIEKRILSKVFQMTKEYRMTF